MSDDTLSPAIISTLSIIIQRWKELKPENKRHIIDHLTYLAGGEDLGIVGWSVVLDVVKALPLW